MASAETSCTRANTNANVASHALARIALEKPARLTATSVPSCRLP
jgi:hypothetical protein